MVSLPITWGPAIPTPNGRPSWLLDTETVVDLQTSFGWGCSDGGAGAPPYQWSWNVIKAIRLPADHAYYMVQRYNQEHGTDLVYWPGGDNPPEDWDGLGRLYTSSLFCDDDWPKRNVMRWNREGNPGDIVGYRRAIVQVEDTVQIEPKTEEHARQQFRTVNNPPWTAGSAEDQHIKVLKELGLIKPEPARLDRFLASTDDPTIEAALEFER